MTNTEQARAWDGEAGRHWAAYQDRFDTMLSRLTVHLIMAAQIAATDRVLDVGCGCGETTRIAARVASRGAALGIDLSGPMLERARVRAERQSVGNVAFEKADAQVAELPTFDVALSRFGVMFFDDPQAAFANVLRSLRPGGRLAFLCWQVADNPYFAVVRSALKAFGTSPEIGDGPGPFSLADPVRVRGLLTGAGFGDVAVDPVNEPVCPGADADEAAEFLLKSGTAQAILADADEATVTKAAVALRTALLPYETPDGVLIESAAWLVTARRPLTDA
jgi:SAM-dependent methyltransferase